MPSPIPSPPTIRRSSRAAALAFALTLAVSLTFPVPTAGAGPADLFGPAPEGRDTTSCDAVATVNGVPDDGTVTIDLPGQEPFVMAMSRDAGSEDVHTWIGSEPGPPARSVVLAADGGVWAGTVVVDEQAYAIRHLDVDLVCIAASSPDNRLGDEEEPVIPPLAATGYEAPAADARSSAVIDVMVVYTPMVRAALGGETAARVFAAARIAELNMILHNSDTDFRARLAYSGVVAYSESSSSMTNLERLRAQGDGFMDEVHALRNLHGADLVALVVGKGGSVGYIMDSLNPAFEAYAFTVSELSMAESYFSVSHEIGHNLGSSHDRDNPASGNLYPYSFGYRVPGEFRTVMAYPCRYDGLDRCPRVPHFSNPEVEYLGYPTGVPVGDPEAADNATGFSEVADFVAGFRSSPGVRCNGLVPTILGTPGPDVLTGTDGPDVIHGLGGADVIKGLEGDDVLCGGFGHDTIRGGGGDDLIFGGAGNDKAWGGPGNDGLVGEDGDDVLSGGGGSDVLDDGPGDDRSSGDKGLDRLLPGPGTDELHGGSGYDWLDLRSVVGDTTVNLYIGVLSSAPTGTDQLSGIRRVRGSAFPDILIGDGRNNVLMGRGGKDVIRGLGGDDALYGNSANDLLEGGGGDDLLNGGPGDDTLAGGPGTDTCVGETNHTCEL